MEGSVLTRCCFFKLIHMSVRIGIYDFLIRLSVLKHPLLGIFESHN